MIDLYYPNESASSRSNLTMLSMKLLWLIFVMVAPALSGATIVIDQQSPQQTFASQYLQQSLSGLTESDGYQIRTALVDASALPLRRGGFNISRSNQDIVITGIDQAGIMYGLLELAEQIEMAGSVAGIEETTQNPRFEFRAIKFNLPWSSYRRFDALQANMEACRDLEMWEDFLSMMALNRFNKLTLWNLHPWPYLVRTKNFPKATPFTDAELVEWKEFWNQLFRMAKERGIETYLLNWNVFVSESFRQHYGEGTIDGDEYNIEGEDSPQIQQYNRESITQVINEYPDLAGLGVTLGEGMRGWDTERQTEWVKNVFFKGIHAADRPIKFIYRAALKGDHAINRQTIDESGLDTPEDPIMVELKFNWSHAFSTTTLIKAHGGGTGSEYWTNPAPTRHKMAWMIRNEDFFRLRWGQPDFIREHIQVNGQDFVGGYFVGSETYIPASDIFHVPDHPHKTWKWAFERQWLFYMQWGRLLYNEGVTDEIFAHAFNRRYEGGYGKNMVEAFKLATSTTQRIAGFFQWTFDSTLYTEGLLLRRNFITIKSMLDRRPTDPSFVSIKDFVQNKFEDDDITPIELADMIEADNARALDLIEGVTTEDPTLHSEIEDVKTWASLGFYFAKKIRSAVAYEQGNKDEALVILESAVSDWKSVISLTEQRFVPSSLQHIRGKNFHWKDYLDDVLKEVEWLRKQ